MDAAARDEVLGSRGSLRMGYLKEFLVMHFKESGQLKRETFDEVHASDSRTETKFHEWTSGVMDREMTKEVAEEIRHLPRDDPMALKWRKCPYTGKEVDPFRVWIVPVRSVLKSEIDTSSHRTRAEGDANDATASLFDTGSKAAADNCQPIVKQEVAEEKTPAQLRHEAAKEIFNDAKPYMRRLQEMGIVQDEWVVKCGDDPFRAPLVTDCTNLKPIINRALAILSKIHKKEISMKEPEHVQSIMMLLDQLAESEKRCNHWAVTYGVVDKTKKTPKRKLFEV